MIFSRIYQFAPGGQFAPDGQFAPGSQLAPGGSTAEVVVNAAAPGANEDDIHENFFDSLRAVFHGNSRRQHGAFDPEATGAALPGGIADYRAQTIDAEQFGARLAAAFKQGLGESGLQQPWYLWLVLERSGETEFVYLFLLKHEESFRLSARHTVVADGAIRLDRLHYAAKVNLTEWQAQSDTALTYLAPRNQNAATLAWKALIGFAENVEHAQKTAALLTAIDRYADSLPEEKEHEYRAKVAEYCLDQDRIGAPVEIRELSRHVDEEAPAALLDFLTEHIEEPATPLYTDRRQLKRYTRLFGRDHDLSIGFSTQMLGSQIIYDERAGTLTLRNIPASLKSQLARHSKKSE